MIREFEKKGFVINTSQSNKKKFDSDGLEVYGAIKDSLRMKPIEVDTATIRKGFDRERSVIQYNENENNEYRFFTYYKMDDNESDVQENQEEVSSDDYLRYQYKEKRVAKEAHEIRDDLLSLFKQKDVWTWDEVKSENKDQPEAPLKKQLQELCDKVPNTGNGGNAQYLLKATFKI